MKTIRKSCGALVGTLALLLFVFMPGNVVSAKEVSDSDAAYVQDVENGTWKFAGKLDEANDAYFLKNAGNPGTIVENPQAEQETAMRAGNLEMKGANTISISTEQELKNIANNLGGNYVLTADIVLNAHEWTAIGDENKPFNGTLDGNGHTISNLISSKGNGLFFSIGTDAVIKNLTISGTVTTTTNSAALLAFFSNGTIINCKTSGSVKQESGTNAWSLAGMVNSNYGYMENCINEAEVAETFGDLGTPYNYCAVGGVVSGNYGTMTGCQNNAAITSNCMYTGGIAGSNRNLLEACVNKGTVTANHNVSGAVVATGGITGDNSNSVIYLCVNEGTVKGPRRNYESDNTLGDYLGGIVGFSDGFSEIIGCENKGFITGRSAVGGICGTCNIMVGIFDENDNFIINEGRQIISDCTNNGEISGTADENKSVYMAGIVADMFVGNGEADCLRCVNNGRISLNANGVEYNSVGGLIGYIYTLEKGHVEVEWLTNTGDVVLNDSSEWGGRTGGIFSALQASGMYSASVKNCVNRGNVSAKNACGIGFVTQNGVLEQCYNLGMIHGDNCSGIAGSVAWDSSVKNCYNLGAITAESSGAGIAGRVDDSSKLETSYNAGHVTGNDQSYGITYAGAVTACYYLKQEFAGSSEQAGQALDQSAMQQSQSYQGFDFNSMWKMQTQNGMLLPAFHAVMELETVKVQDISMRTSDTVAVRAETGNCIDYVSTNALICDVDSIGNVTPKKVGTVKVYGISEDGQMIGFQITVKGEQTLTAAISNPKIAVGKTASIQANGIGTITYSSSDTSVATVSSAGIVKGKKVGTVTITVTAAGDSYYDAVTKEISVKVVAPAKGTTFTDSSSKAKYKVTKAGSTVEYTKSANSKATKITIPATVKMHGVTYKVTSVAGKAFKDNKKITKVVIGKNVTSVGTSAFSGCTKLTSITLPAELTTIGEKAFYKCTALTSIVIPSKVSKIGKQAFGGDKKLKTITIKTTKLTSKNVGDKAFSGIYSKAVIKVPKSKLSAYKKLLKSRGAGSKVTFKKLN